MRKILAALLLCTATPALADPMHCFFEMKGGGEIMYSFEKVNDNLFAEVSFIKNGTQTISPVGQRPPWIVLNLKAGLTLTFAQDRRYWIGIPNGQVYRSSAGSAMKAVLLKSKTILGAGACGFVTEDPNADGSIPDGL